MRILASPFFLSSFSCAPRPRTHITIYHCNAYEGTSKQIDYFSVNPKIWALFVDTTHLALLWDDTENGQQAYIRMYTKGLQTDIMRLKDPVSNIEVLQTLAHLVL